MCVVPFASVEHFRKVLFTLLLARRNFVHLAFSFGHPGRKCGHQPLCLRVFIFSWSVRSGWPTIQHSMEPPGLPIGPFLSPRSCPCATWHASRTRDRSPRANPPFPGTALQRHPSPCPSDKGGALQRQNRVRTATADRGVAAHITDLVGPHATPTH